MFFHDRSPFAVTESASFRIRSRRAFPKFVIFYRKAMRVGSEMIREGALNAELFKKIGTIVNGGRDASRDKERVVVRKAMTTIYTPPRGRRMIDGKLDNLTVLCLGRFILANKTEYHHRLRMVTEQADWQGFLAYMLDGIKETADQTTLVIEEIRRLVTETIDECKRKLPVKVYSKELVELIFSALILILFLKKQEKFRVRLKKRTEFFADF